MASEQNNTATRPVVVNSGLPNVLTPKEAVAESKEKTVTMIFPRQCMLAVTHTKRILFKEGANEVPVSLVNHPYLKAHGVKKYDPKATPAQQQVDADDDNANDVDDSTDNVEQKTEENKKKRKK